VQALFALPLVVVAVLSAAIAFDSPARLPAVPGGGVIPGSAEWSPAEIPEQRRITARDGAPLMYRYYPGDPTRVVVLVHGSTGTSLDLHKLALALQAAGGTSYAVSLRGHGGSGTGIGDVSYIGQLDDDMVDLLKSLGIDKPGVRRTLIGYSVGGGFALRLASGPHHALFDDYIAVAPYIATYRDLLRRHLGGWANVSTFRNAALDLLDGIGLPWFQELPAERYAVDPTPSDKRTPAYSYRMLRSLHIDYYWRSALRRISEPTVILTSDADDLSNASRYTHLDNPHVQIGALPSLEHDELLTSRSSLTVIVATWRRLTGLDGVAR
jgi:pimeloyl-ACP methyl ester carboxylesterase